MATITLNGVSSTTIQGLLIQELPPISKPKIRTLVEEVDGRDGDIITKLGYSAYDKKIKIGLTRNYDVNAVIKYFDSEGTVVFSNEPDKYYNYQILNQIDFEKLLRFKEAEVVFHVQPFKYDANEVIEDISGNPVTSISINNLGNTISRPILSIFGSGTVTVSLNGDEIFVINMSNINDITINTDEMNAFSNGNFANRMVQGDYSAFILDSGQNSIVFTGLVTRVTVSNFSRWI